MKTHLLLKRLLLLWVFAFSGSLWGQVTLPHTRTAWNSTPSGWTETNNNAYTTIFACSGNNGAKFDASSQIKTVHLDSSPDKLSFVVKSNATTSSILLVQESTDNINYTTVVNLSGTTDLPTTCTTKGDYQLLPSTRYIKWTFTKGSQNLTMDDVSITKLISTGPTLIATPTTLTAMTYEVGTGPSNVKSFALAGTNLDGTQNVDLVPGDNWEISPNGTAWVDATSSLVLTNYSGTSIPIYVRLKSGLAVGTYDNASDDIIIIDGYSITGAPEVTLSGTVTAPVVTTTFTADGTNTYTYVAGTGPSAEKGYKISGNNLTTDLVLTAPTNYEVSMTTGTGFANSLNVIPTSGIVASTQVYVRLKSGLTAGSYNGNLTLASTGIANKTIALTGSVTAPVPTNDLCDNPETVIINATAINGTLKGATITTPFNQTNDVWYKFTVTNTADYTITVGGFVGDVDFELFSTKCPTVAGSYIGRAFTLSNPEVLTENLLSGTYYVRVNSGGSTAASTSDFTISITAAGNLMADQTSLTFGNVDKGANSTAQTVNVSGNFLSSNASVIVTAPTDYEVSLTGTDLDFHNNVSLTADANGVLTSTPVYVRFNTANVCGASSGNVAITSSGASTVNIAVTGTAIMPNTTATSAANITETSFDATWLEVPGATGYELEVSKSPTFDTSATATLTEGFETGLPTSYQTGAVTLSSGTWMGTDLIRGTTGKKSGSYSAQLKSATGSALVSPSFANGISSISFWVSGSGSAIQVNYSTDGGTTWTPASNSPFTDLTSTVVQKTVTFNTTVPTMIQLRRSAGTIYIDDIEFTYGSSTPDFVTGYAPKSVAGGSTVTAPVTGLTSGTKYYYRVRALNGSCNSVNSNVKDVTTLTPTTTWNGVALGWSNSAPNSNTNAIIAEDYNETINITAKNLTVNLGKTLTVKTNKYVKAEKVFNNGNIVVENDANFVQTDTFTPAVSGGSTFKVKRNSKAVQRLDYISWSSPMEISDQTLKDFSKGNSTATNYAANGTLNTRFYTYNGGEFVNTPTLNAEKFSKGQGYHIRTPSDYTTGTAEVFQGLFEGTKPNTGTFTYTAPNTGTPSNDQYVFLGNPYPSAISMDSFMTTNTQTTGTIYIWNSQAKMDANYLYTGSTNYNIYTSSGANPFGLSDVIPVGQSFFVDRGTNNSITNYSSFVFNDGMRVTTETGTFAKSATTDRFWLQMASASGAKPQMLFAFNADATTGLDNGYDGKKFDNYPNSFYTKINGEKMAIDTHNSFQTMDSFDLYINSDAIKNYTISTVQKDGVFNNGGQSIFLKDKANGVITDLSTTDYSFTSAGTGEENRFMVYFTNSVLATSNVVKEEVSIYGTQSMLVVESPNEISSVKVYDMAGRLILNKKVQGKVMKATINDAKIVLVSVELKDGTTVSKKVKL